MEGFSCSRFGISSIPDWTQILFFLCIFLWPWAFVSRFCFSDLLTSHVSRLTILRFYDSTILRFYDSTILRSLDLLFPVQCQSLFTFAKPICQTMETFSTDPPRRARRSSISDHIHRVFSKSIDVSHSEKKKKDWNLIWPLEETTQSKWRIRSPSSLSRSRSSRAWDNR